MTKKRTRRLVRRLRRRHGTFLLVLHAAALATPLLVPSAPLESAPRPRIIATTDGEIDDRCSMIRFLLYANEWDIEGIIYSSSKFHWKGHDWAGEAWIERDIGLYAECYDTLRRHAPGFPTPEYLRSVTFAGNIDSVGEIAKETPGSRRIVEVLLDDRPGPVFLQAWGGTNTIARALRTIEERHPDEKARVSRKAVIYIILDQDRTFREYILPHWPELEVIGSFRQFGTIAYGWKRAIPPRLHRFFEGPWMRAHVLERHGPLCARYEAHTGGRGGWNAGDFRSEGDSPSFMYAIQNGLGSLAHPSYGGWGGRFVKEPGTRNVWRGAADDGDLARPIWRWAEHFQNDWAARADWCVKPVEDANHNPIPVVNGVEGRDIVTVEARSGATVTLSAAGSCDPDGDELAYEWWYYRDPSTYRGEIRIDGEHTATARLTVPVRCMANELHIILTIHDDGEPNLYAYRRVIIRSPGRNDGTPPAPPSGLRAQAREASQVVLSWNEAVDTESGVRRYVVYRDDERIGDTPVPGFVDDGLRESTSYRYEVSAVNGCEREGATAEALVRTAADTTPPAIVSVRAAGAHVVVVFSEPVDRTSATRAGNYAIAEGLPLSHASLDVDGRTVTLAQTGMREGVAYTLLVSGVRDLAQLPNLIPAGTPARFVYRTCLPAVRVGFTTDETPLRFHGDVRRERDGSLFLAPGPPWRWIGVGPGERPLGSLQGLESFTILGWVRAVSLAAGSGGNRIAFSLDYDHSGFDLVQLADGRLRLAVNEWPDHVSNDSSPRRIRVGHWVFFAVTYDGTRRRDNVHWYFGDEDSPATRDRTTTYARGAVGVRGGPLTVGNYNATIHEHGRDRQFRGWLRGLEIFASRSGNEGALDLAGIRREQDETGR